MVGVGEPHARHRSRDGWGGGTAPLWLGSGNPPCDARYRSGKGEFHAAQNGAPPSRNLRLVGEGRFVCGEHGRLSHEQVCVTEFFIDNLLVRIHLIIKMILVGRPYAMEVWIAFSR